MLSAFGCLFSAWEASMGFAEYSNYDGLGLAELVNKKEVKPAELVEAAMERIERHNPSSTPLSLKPMTRRA
jgi:Asp-tRNA(Asn)/Glu-tRNA(Gln) amidotransferase A subunit family amidase